MTQHVTRDVLARFARGKLPPAETLAVARHLEECDDCRGAAEGTLDWESAAETWRGTLNDALDEHLRGDALLDYADGTLSAGEVPEADAHLEHCAQCREDVADLRRLRRGRARWARTGLRVAAGLLIATGLGVLAWRIPSGKPSQVVKPPSIAAAQPAVSTPKLPDSWSALVGEAVAARRLDPPAVLAALRMPTETLRSEGVARKATAVSPDGVVIEDPRPTFHWGAAQAAVYRVSLFASDLEVAHSEPLQRNEWIPDRDLERGRTYRWQVEVHRGGENWILPRAPQPAPIFRLLDETAQRDLDAARQRAPEDHLLLGVLAAHYGLQDEAIAQLTLHHSSHPDPAAAELLASVRAWNGEPQ